MPEAHPDYIGIYGNLRIPKAYCEDCGSYAFIVDGKFACCGKPHIPNPMLWKRESAPPDEWRRRPGQADQKLILEAQNYGCFWCDRRFGLAVWLGKQCRVLKIHWDHMVPWAYDQNNALTNVVASCNVCNLWKSSLIFQTIEQCRIYLKGKWDEKQGKVKEDFGPKKLPELSCRIHPEEGVGEVLLDKMPMDLLEQEKPARKTIRASGGVIGGKIPKSVRNSMPEPIISTVRRKARKRKKRKKRLCLYCGKVILKPIVQVCGSLRCHVHRWLIRNPTERFLWTTCRTTAILSAANAAREMRALDAEAGGNASCEEVS